MNSRLMRGIQAATAVTGLILSPMSLAQYWDSPYTDKYGSKSIRLMQAERAFTAGYRSGQQDQSRPPRISANGQTKSGVFTDLMAGDQPADLTRAAPAALGRGTKEKLSEAISRILPGDCWSARIDEDLMDMEVDWRGDKPWTDVVRELSQTYGFHSYVNMQDCVLYLSSTPYFDTDELGGNPYQQVWVLPKGARLSEVLKNWAEVANWSFEWEPYPKDLVIEHPAKITGPFEGENGAVAQVCRAYEGSDLPIMYEFNEKNRALVIRERKYSQGL